MIEITKNTTNRLSLSRNYTNVLKFLTSLLIASHHFCGVYYSYTDNKSFLLRAMVTMGGVIGVNLFFFLSGYGLMMSEKKKHLSFYAFIRKRLIKVYLPAVLVGVFGTALFHFAYHQEQNLREAVFNILLLNSDNVFWFLQVLIILYVVFGVSTQIMTHNKIAGTLSLIVLTLFVSVADWYMDVDYHATNIPAFAFGCLVALFDEKTFALLNSKKSVLTMLLVTIVLVFSLKDSIFWFHALAAYTVVVIIIVTSAFIRIDVSNTKLMGDLSYDIYLIHNKVNYLTLMMEGKLLYLWYMAIVMAASLIFNKIRKILHI